MDHFQNSNEDSDLEELKASIACYDPNAMLDVLESLEENEEDEAESSRPKIRRRYICRDRLGAGERLWRDYFSENSTFPEDYFRRRFRMSNSLFLRICQGITSYSQQPLPPYFSFFHQARDVIGTLGFNIYQKCTSAIRQLAYGCAADAFDEYLHMGQQTSYDCLDNFCKCIFHLYSTEYLRKPTLQDVQRLHAKHLELHGFPGMLRSIDCMHWPWKNCPVAWKGQYTRGDHGHPTIMLEAVASYDLWIWHAYFGPAGSNNDINVLNESDLFKDLLQDRAPEVRFTVNGVEYKNRYYLADGIYPEWVTLVKSFKCPIEEKNIKYKRFQEAARKDLERAFGVLQGRWAILKNPARPYIINKIRRIMYTCVILHNMITEDNRRNICQLEEDYLRNPNNLPRRSWSERVEVYQRMDKELRDRRMHHSLRNNLIEHIWSLPSNYRTRLMGKVAIVTGGARGIGGATSKLMAENGAHVIIADVLDEIGADLAKSIGGVYIHCDVSKESDVESAVQLALLSKGKLDIIFCNAGIIDNGRSITNLEMKNVASLINVNLNGVIHGIKHAARAMISLDNKGSIICCTSSAAIMGGLASHAYTLTKGAILGISRSAACELGVHGIRVNCVSPHGIPSEMLVKAYRDHLGKPNTTIEIVSDMISKTGSLLHGRCGTVEDVAQTVLFLVSEEAGFITGHNLVIDGGYTSASVK